MVRVLRQRRVRVVLLAGVGFGFLALAIAMMGGNRDSNDQLASIVSAFAAIASLGASVLSLFWVPSATPTDLATLAEDLAATVRDEWAKEAEARQLHGARVLPMTWRSGTEVGRLTDRFDRAQRQLAVEYREVKSGRLVVLGEPGSGKTVLAMLLALGLLADRARDSPVPVLLSASSWDPLRASFDKWIVESLSAYYNGRTETARKLLDNGFILPVVDGLDEIPEVSRREAVRKINKAVGLDRPVVLTCRQAEYDDLIKGGFPALLNAPVARVQPLAVDEVADYLKTDSSAQWAPVIDVLRREPESPLAQALSTPLMVSLARMAYSRGGEPAELTELPANRHVVEDHVVDRVIDAAYRPDDTDAPPPWTGTQARQWLEFLARYLHAHRDRDLAWWRLADRVVSPWVAPMLGVVLGTAVLVLVSMAGKIAGIADGEKVTAAGAAAAAIVTLVAITLWFGTSGRRPGRMGLVWRGSRSRLWRGFRAGAAFIVVPGLPILVLGSLSIAVINPADDIDEPRSLVQSAMIGVAIAFVAGCAVATHHWLDATPARSAKATPLDLIRQDRQAALVSALAAGAVAGLLTWPAIAAGAFVGEVLGQALGGSFALSGTTEFSEITEMFGLRDATLAAGVLVVLPFVGVTLLVLLTRAWSRFAVARTALAVTRRLPWRLLHFLADARERGLLRQSGGVYQFRHVRIQEQLALPGDDTPAADTVPPARTRRRRFVAIGLTIAGVATAVVTLVSFNDLRCAAPLSLSTDVDRVRVFTDTDAEACVGVVDDRTWARLMAESEVFRQLHHQNDQATSRSRFTTVALIVPVDLPTERTDVMAIVEGVVVAQQEAMRQGHPMQALLVDSGPSEPTDVPLERAVSYAARHGYPVRAAIGLETYYFLDKGIAPLFGPPKEPVTEEWLLEPIMWAFVANELGATAAWHEQELDSDDRERCQEADNTVNFLDLYYDAFPGDTVFTNLDDLACPRNPVVATTNGTAARSLLERDAALFPNLTVYYPVARPSGARDYATAADAAGLPVHAGGLTEATYRVTLNAAGVSEFAIHRITATPTGWTTTVVRP